jgi:hypothetical protein
MMPSAFSSGQKLGYSSLARGTTPTLGRLGPWNMGLKFELRKGVVYNIKNYFQISFSSLRN